ncbi:MAG: toll/interleukin-1 receptor domain-containing protein [Oscillospiraceae bacterium]
MKIFVSWSGELSCQIAEILKKWIPCILQSVEVFFSPEDIEKGDNWDKIITTELSECKYGIICLTTDNTTAPWVNFEAGAIAKSLDSRVTALMVNIKPSDIKGPLSRYQATKFEKDDFFQLITSINKVLESPLEHSVLQTAFNAMWTSLEKEALSTIEKHIPKDKDTELKDTNSNAPENEALEEILQLLRQQSSLLSNPEKLLPIEYMDFVQRKMGERNKDLYAENEMFNEELLHYLDNVLKDIYRLPSHSMSKEILHILKFEDLLQILTYNSKRKGNKRIHMQILRLQERYSELIHCEMSSDDMLLNLSKETIVK